VELKRRRKRGGEEEGEEESIKMRSGGGKKNELFCRRGKRFSSEVQGFSDNFFDWNGMDDAEMEWIQQFIGV
jgi:hypothetical protein